MRLRRRIFCILTTLLTLLLDTSVMPFTGLGMQYLPRICLVNVILIGTILGGTQGIIYGALAGILLGISAYQPAGLVAIMYTACAMTAGAISRKIKPALVTVLPPIVGYSMYELSMLMYYYVSTGFFPLAKFGLAGIRLAVALVLIQILYIPWIKILKPSSIGKSRR